MTKLQHFLTTKLLQNLPDQQDFNISIQQDYYMTNLQHFLTTKLLQNQPPEILNNETTT